LTRSRQPGLKCLAYCDPGFWGLQSKVALDSLSNQLRTNLGVGRKIALTIENTRMLCSHMACHQERELEQCELP